MADSRKQLKSFLGKRINCSGTFNKITHKRIKNAGVSKPVILVRDIYIVDDHFKNQEYLSDHVWIDITPTFFTNIEKEIFDGDIILFSAIVGEYKITRDDIIEGRDTLKTIAQQENDIAYKKYRERYLDWKDEWNSVKENNSFIEKQFDLGNISQTEMEQIKHDNIQQYNNQKPTYNSGHEKLKNIDSEIDRNLKLVDYEFSEIVVTKKHAAKFKLKRLKSGWSRLTYDHSKTKDIKYTKFLAARSIAYSKKIPYDEFSARKPHKK